MSKAIDDFDWVEARYKWNAKIAFKQLLDEVNADGSRLQELSLSQAQFIRMEMLSADRFFVKRFDKPAIVFKLADSKICIEKTDDVDHSSPMEIMTLTTAIDRDGECVFVDQDGKHLRSWQVRMLALSDTFFPD